MSSLCRALLPFAAFMLLVSPATAAPVPPPPRLEARAWILMDEQSGRIIASKNADVKVEPASLTKLMTAYAVFHAIADGKLRLDTEIPVSERAWRAEGSRTFVEVGTRVPAEVLLKGMIVQSGNDASIALAEAVGGTEETFAALMNQYAARLGMTNSHFENSTGLPGANHLVTARDMAILARAIIDEFPEYYRWYSERSFTWNGITQSNRNGLLDQDPAVDGMKTGHTESAGYCLVSSAQRNGMRMIAVMLGADSVKERETSSLALLNYGFNFFETRRIHPRGAEIAIARVYGADGGEAPVGLRSEFYVTVPRGQVDAIQYTVQLEDGLSAPLAADRRVGTLRATLNDRPVAIQPLYPLADVAEGGFFRRLWDAIAARLD